jgi:hypothetical protein
LSGHPVRSETRFRVVSWGCCGRDQPAPTAAVRVLILRLARENPSWGYKRVHGELATLGIKFAPSPLWEILKQEGVAPSPTRTSTTWAYFLRPQADALLACDFIEAITLDGHRQHILAVIEHATGRVHVLSTTAHPTAAWISQVMKNLVMDLEDADCRTRYLIRDRHGKFPVLMDQILANAEINMVLTGIRVPSDELGYGEVGAVLPPRTPGPLPALERTPPATRLVRVRTVLQPAPSPPSSGPGGTTTHRPRSDHRSPWHSIRKAYGCCADMNVPSSGPGTTVVTDQPDLLPGERAGGAAELSHPPRPQGRQQAARCLVARPAPRSCDVGAGLGDGVEGGAGHARARQHRADRRHLRLGAASCISDSARSTARLVLKRYGRPTRRSIRRGRGFVDTFDDRHDDASSPKKSWVIPQVTYFLAKSLFILGRDSPLDGALNKHPHAT